MPNIYVVLRSDEEAWLLEWSTTLDAPLQPGVRVTDVNRRDDDIVRAFRYGTSAMLPPGVVISGEENIVVNRAGKDETILTIDEIVEHYCRRQAHGTPPRGFDPREHSRAETDAFIAEQFAELQRLGLSEPSDLS